MKIYVAASSSKSLNRAEELIRSIRRMPQHSITYDWTKDVRKFGVGDPKLIPEAQLIKAATNDRQGVRDCDLFILIWHPEVFGAVMELGMAMEQAKPIWIIGETERGLAHSIRFSVFYFLPDCKAEFKYPFEVIQELEHWSD